MFTASFWANTAERALKTFAQTLLVIWPIGDAALHLYDIDWRKALLTAGLAAGASVLTSFVSAPIGPDGSPSLVGEPPKEPEALAAGDHALDGTGRDGQDEKPMSVFDHPRPGSD